jgi:hypothetical protein
VTATRDGDGIACRPQGPGRSPAERRVGGTPVGRLRGEGGRSCGRRRWKKAKLIWTRLLITKPTPAVPSAPIDGQRAEHLLRSHHNLRSDWAGAHACHRYEASGLTSRMALPLIRCACTRLGGLGKVRARVSPFVCCLLTAAFGDLRRVLSGLGVVTFLGSGAFSVPLGCPVWGFLTWRGCVVASHSGGGIRTRDLRVMRRIDGGAGRHIWLCGAKSGPADHPRFAQIGTKIGTTLER